MCRSDGISTTLYYPGERYSGVPTVWELRCGAGNQCAGSRNRQSCHRRGSVITSKVPPGYQAIYDQAPRISRAVRRWGSRNLADYPWRRESEPWLQLTAEILLQRTRASTVSVVFEQFRDEYPTPSDLAGGSTEDLERVIGSLGLRWRIPLLIELAKEISASSGRIPEDLTSLLKLPGVGPYAAAAYLSLHRGKRAVIIDANVVRWLCRLTGAEMDGETRRKRWVIELADRLTPIRAFRDYNYGVLDFTMSVCANMPTCHACSLAPMCDYGRTRQVE